MHYAIADWPTPPRRTGGRSATAATAYRACIRRAFALA
jgi:hypothetical protein